jgi:hypothetical protein
VHLARKRAGYALTEDVSLMSSAFYAVNLGAHTDEVVPLVARLELNTFELVVEARPPGAAVEFGLGRVGRRPAPGIKACKGGTKTTRGHCDFERAARGEEKNHKQASSARNLRKVTGGITQRKRRSPRGSP